MNECKLVDIGKIDNDWSLHKVDSSRSVEGEKISDLINNVYRREFNNQTCSLGQFLLNGKEIFRAWGYLAEKDCSFYTVAKEDGTPTEAIYGCPDISFAKASDGSTILILKAGDTTVNHSVKLE